MIISLIAAVAENNYVIGNKNKLLWHIPQDMLYFRKLTLNKPVIMGRKTFESIGKPLPKRLNIILSKNSAFRPEGAIVFNTLEKAFEYCKNKKYKEVFVIGGSRIYRLALPFVDKLYITWVQGKFEGDAYFPKVDWKQWEKKWEEKHKGYRFTLYTKK